MDDEEWDHFLAEAATFSSAPMMRQLFATVLIECNPEDPTVSINVMLCYSCEVILYN